MSNGGWDSRPVDPINHERKIMSNRAKEVAQSYADKTHYAFPSILADHLASLPEFQEKKSEWVRCEDRMPEPDQPLYWHSAS